MQHSSVRPADVLERVIDTYGNMLFRYSFIMLGNVEDAEDAVQDTLMKYWQKTPVFKDKDHEKAWLLTVISNRCKDMLRFRLRHSVIDMEDVKEFLEAPEQGVGDKDFNMAGLASDSGIFEALVALPEKFKLVLYLYYVEEYRIEDIAGMIGRTPSAVKMRLKKGRQLLEEKYRKEYM